MLRPATRETRGLCRLVVPVVALSFLAALAATSAVAAPAQSAGRGNGNGGAGTSGTDNGRHQLTGTRPTWTAAVKQTGVVAASTRLSAKVWLAPRNQAQLTALGTAVSDPASSQYRRYLTHAQYVAQYAPTSAQVSAVTGWLKQARLTVSSVGPDNHYVAVSGSASAMTAAFGAQLALYSVNGEQAQAPTSDLSVPSSLADSVLAVTGLVPLGHRVEPADLGAPAAFVNGTPCSSYYGEQKAQDLPKFQGKALPYAVCGYVPSQLRGAYGVDQSGSAGAGQTVAITDAFDASTLKADADEYATRHGDAAFVSGQFSDRSTPDDPARVADCGGNGWYGEQTLDIEAVHGMAPGANVAYYGAASCYDDDLAAALARVVADNDASIVTNSWGEPTFLVIDGTLYTTIDKTIVGMYESVFLQGAVQGIGFYFSSGDSGDELATWGYKHPDYPTGDPWVTSVGGTSLAVGSGNTRTFETGWGTAKWSLTADGSAWTQSIPFQYGAGGGYSEVFAQPSYQDGVVTSNPTGGRAVPDIAMDADPTTGMLIGETQTFPDGVRYGEYRIGGTSLASPLLAGAQAVAQQRRGSRIGFANPLIYGLKAHSNGSSSFYDPKATQPDPGNVRADFVNGLNADDGYVYSVRTFDQDSSLQTDKAWDDVTGVGTVTGRYINQVAAG
jgi:subtilase family serine protease